MKVIWLFLHKKSNLGFSFPKFRCLADQYDLSKPSGTAADEHQVPKLSSWCRLLPFKKKRKENKGWSHWIASTTNVKLIQEKLTRFLNKIKTIWTFLVFQKENVGYTFRSNLLQKRPVAQYGANKQKQEDDLNRSIFEFKTIDA